MGSMPDSGSGIVQSPLKSVSPVRSIPPLVEETLTKMARVRERSPTGRRFGVPAPESPNAADSKSSSVPSKISSPPMVSVRTQKVQQQICECGNAFMEDAQFCCKCGSERYKKQVGSMR